MEVAAALIDLRAPAALRRYGVRVQDLTQPDNYEAPRRVGARLIAERRAGAIVPAATMALACNVVVFPDVWSRFTVRRSVPLALDGRLVRLAAAALGPSG